MAIKFRCQNCRQMLGISRSRAGAIVDCPGCGRSLRVPNSDGTSTSVSSESRLSSADDEQLRAALNELSLLSTPETESPFSDSLRIVPLAPPPHRMADAVAPTAVADPEPADADETTPWDESPAGESQTLAAVIQDLPPATSFTREHAAEQIPTESRSVVVGGRSKASSGLGPVITGMLCAIAFLAGSYVSVTFPSVAGIWQPARQISQSSNEVDVSRTEPLPSVDAGTTNSQFGTLIGSVAYQTAQGTQSPDAGALVLLLPATAATQLKLDGRSLRETDPNAEQRAVRAALEQLGASFTRSDTAGRWELPRLSADEMRLVVVSRHKTHPEGLPTEAAVQSTLNEYFQNAAQFSGRLKVVGIAIPSAKTSDADSSEYSVLIP